MNKKTWYIVLAALGVVALIALLWWWFFNRSPQIQPPTNTGTFGTASNANTTNTNGGTETNGATPGSGITGETGGSGSGGSTNGNGTNGGYTVGTNGVNVLDNGSSDNGSYTIGGVYSGGSVGVPGVAWLAGSTTGSGAGGTSGGGTSGSGTDNGGAGTVFNPLGINQIDSSNPSGGVIPNIGSGSTGTGSASSGLGLGGALIGAGVAGAVTCTSLLPTIAGYVASFTSADTAAVGGTAAAGTAATAAVAVSTDDVTTHLALASLGGVVGINNGLHSADENTSFLSCMARTIARAALQEITVSVVNWINSGFNGSPSFVTNPSQFFNNVANVAAGQFIQGSALSFLCSPFQLQIKIAIAQSYANQNAQSCTLTGVINNINGFMSGDFNAGGWPGLLAFTTTPTNNPYGAYMYADIGIKYSVQTAVGQQQRQLSLGNGFLDFTQNQNCQTTSSPPPASASVSVTPITGNGNSNSYNNVGAGSYVVCNIVHTTPGSVIAASLNKTLGNGQDELNMAKDFDEIISALVTQLMTRTLQGGLLNVTGSTGNYANNFYTPDELQAQSEAQALITTMQSDTLVAQSYGGVEQGSISDIENAQSQLNTLVNCWSNAAANSTDPSKQSQALANAAAASSTIATFNTQIDAYNNNITQANSAVTELQNLQSQALSAASTADADSITSQYNNDQGSGLLITQDNVTNAQQDRTTLQSQLATINQQTNTGLEQCNAF